MSDKSDWLPTMSGTHTAYEPQWMTGGEWKRIPTRRDPFGVPQPLLGGGVNSTLGLFGHEQANALAWEFAAYAAHSGKKIEVRVQAYEVVYELKARRIDAAMAPSHPTA